MNTKRYSSEILLSKVLCGCGSTFFAAIIYWVEPPPIFDDLYRFHHFHQKFLGFDFRTFLHFLNQVPDFLSSFYLFVGAKTGFSAHFVLAAITYATVAVYLMVFDRSVGAKSLGVILLSLVGLSVAPLLSGVRNMHSSVLVLASFYLWFKSQRRFALFIYVLAVLTHFSSVLFLPFFFLSRCSVQFFRLFWKCSFCGFLVFIIQPYLPEFFFKAESVLPQQYALRLSYYLYERDYYYSIVPKDLKLLFFSLLKFSWFGLLNYFLIVHKPKETEIAPLQQFYTKLLYFGTGVSLFLIVFLTVAERYMILVKMVFVILLMLSCLPSGKKNWSLSLLSAILLVTLLIYFEGFLDFI
ncbi:hypothetical protein FO610_04530 [Riemerella anatipestifer]|nr:hypothetical protein [Riemerella anatipestifer]